MTTEFWRDVLVVILGLAVSGLVGWVSGNTKDISRLRDRVSRIEGRMNSHANDP